MELGINNGNEIYWTGEYNEADFTSPTSFADNSWHHLVVTYDGATRTAVGYLDGVVLGSHVLGSDWNTALDGTGLMVGGPEYQGYFFHGDLDDVAIYGSVLSPSRVLAHYSAARLAGLATTTYSYDGAGRKASETDPDGHVTSYGYDADGNQTSLTDALGRVTTQTFDADNRLTAISYSDGLTPNVTYTYDSAGRRTSMVDGTGTSHYTYNAAKQLTSVTDGAGTTVGYAYNGLGQITAITYPDAHQVTRGYDADGRLASVTDWNHHTNTFGYDGDGNLTSTTFGNGVIETSTVDPGDQITGIAIANAGGSSLASFGYTYTAGGQVAAVTDSLAPVTNNTYGYTANSQLAAQNGDPTAYGYDGSGNITGTDTGDALTYDPAGRLISDQPSAGATATRYGYDNNGNRTTATGATASTTYGYDQANRLTNYAGPTVNSTYAYDGDGLRASVTGDGAQTDTWDTETADVPLLLSDGTDDYLYGPNDQAVEQVDQTSGSATYLQDDRLGSVRTITDQTGAVVGTTSYDPYGRTLTHTGAASTIFGYTGQQTDPTGLIYLRARYYDPTEAAFISVDPLVDVSDASYAYADANPLDEVDPAGDLPYVDDLVDGGNTPAHNKAVTMAAAQLELRPQFTGNVYADVTGFFSTRFHRSKTKLTFLNNPGYEPDIVAYDGDARTYFIYEVKPYSTKGLASSSITQVTNYVKVGAQCLGGTVKLGPSSYIVPETQEWNSRWITIFPRAEDHKFIENVFKNNKDYTGLIFYIQTGKNPRKQMYKVKHQSGGVGRLAHDVGHGASTAGRGIAVAAGATASAINSAYNGFENLSESQPELAGIE